MRLMFRAGAISIVLLLMSCASMPTQQELASADYGEYPYSYEQIIKSYLEQRLKDPYSAEYRHIKGPEKRWAGFFGRSNYGYSVCYKINAKNSFGGFTGYKTHNFMIYNSQVVQHIYESGERSDIMGQVALDRCR